MKVLHQIYKHLVARKWIIGIADFSNELLEKHYSLKINWVKNPIHSSWFADPFIVAEDSHYIKILVEEYPYKTRRGRISRLLINKDTFVIDDVKVILDIDTHLSFPYIIRKNNSTYIIPENSASGELNLYQYDEVNDSLTYMHTICKKPMCDATICKIDGLEYLMTTEVPYENGNRLNIYTVDKDLHNCTKCETYEFDNNIARNAGTPFLINDILIRPAQKCNKEYGEGMILQEVNVGQKGFSFKNIKELKSPLKRYPIAFHTFNVFNNRYIAVDAQGYKYPLIGRVIEKIAKLIKNIVNHLIHKLQKY